MTLKFLWIQNSDHRQPILSVLRFFNISLCRVCKKGTSLVTIALENHLSLESFFFFQSRKELLPEIWFLHLLKQVSQNSAGGLQSVSVDGLVVRFKWNLSVNPSCFLILCSTHLKRKQALGQTFQRKCFLQIYRLSLSPYRRYSIYKLSYFLTVFFLTVH